MSKFIEISGKHKGEFFEVDDEDYEEFSKHTWYLNARGYPSTTITAHQMAMGIFKRQGKTIIDHKNGNSLDNKKSNLRFVNSFQNMQNKKLDSRNKLGYKGVVKRERYTNRPYSVFIGGGGASNQNYIGTYKTIEEAARAYDKEAKKRFGEYARLNFPEES